MNVGYFAFEFISKARNTADFERRLFCVLVWWVAHIIWGGSETTKSSRRWLLPFWQTGIMLSWWCETSLSSGNHSCDLAQVLKAAFHGVAWRWCELDHWACEVVLWWRKPVDAGNKPGCLPREKEANLGWWDEFLPLSTTLVQQENGYFNMKKTGFGERVNFWLFFAAFL